MAMRSVSDGDTFATFSKLLETVRQQILSLDNEYVLKDSKTELQAYNVDR